MATSTENASATESTFDLLNPLRAHVHWLVRLSLAGIFLFHGLNNIGNAEGLAGMLGLPVAMVLLSAVAETVAGALVLVGGLGASWATRLSGLLMAPVMAGAIVLVHWGQWSFAPSASHPMGGMEFQVLLLGLGLYLAVRGNDL